MTVLEMSERVGLANILYLTDFSESADAALPFVRTIAKQHGSKVHVLHVLTPDPYVCMTPEMSDVVNDGLAEMAKRKIQRIALQLGGIPHDTLLDRASGVEPAFQRELLERNIDLVAVGTHARSGLQKFMLGSTAETIFRTSMAPVLVVGPSVERNTLQAEKIRCILIATDLSYESQAAASYAFSLAQQNHAQLIALHVVPQSGKQPLLGHGPKEMALQQLRRLTPNDADLAEVPELVVECGRVAEKILTTAARREADLIVIGARHSHHVEATAHFMQTTAHELIASATCPVITVRCNQ